MCREEHITFNDGLEEDVVVCECNEDKCNGDSPNVPSKGAFVQVRKTYQGIMFSFSMLLVSFLPLWKTEIEDKILPFLFDFDHDCYLNFYL